MWEAQIVLSTKHYKFHFSVLYILEMYNNFIKRQFYKLNIEVLSMKLCKIQDVSIKLILRSYSRLSLALAR